MAPRQVHITLLAGYRVAVIRVWRARDVARPERVYYMGHAADDAFVPLELRYENKEEDFPGWIHAADLGMLRVVHASAPRGEAIRTPRLIRRADPERYGLFFQLRERKVFEQDGRQATLRPGGFAFADLSRPFRLAGSMSDIAFVSFPRAHLPLDRQVTRNLAGVGFSGELAASALVSSLIRRLVNDLHAYSGAAGARVGSAVLDLVTATLTARLDRPDALGPQRHRRALLLQIYAFIEERLGDPELSPPAIAGAHHISLRYLHKLFESEQKTVAGWVRSRRLERCRRDLADPALRLRPVSAIAARWGLADPTVFSKAFRKAYGMPPSEYRRLCV